MLFALLAAALVSYWTVHIDVPEDRAAFERLDAQFDQVNRDFYAAHDVSPPTVWRIRTADGEYIGLRPRGAWTEVTKSALPPELSKELQQKTAPISEATHKVLRRHHSEIWQLQPELSTRADNPMPRRYSMMRTDTALPPKNNEYEAAMKQLVGELQANGIETLAFFSTYGDGAYHYIFSSDKPIRLRRLTGLAETRDVDVTVTIR